jgi:hypothetical protein
MQGCQWEAALLIQMPLMSTAPCFLYCNFRHCDLEQVVDAATRKPELEFSSPQIFTVHENCHC